MLKLNIIMVIHQNLIIQNLVNMSINITLIRIFFLILITSISVFANHMPILEINEPLLVNTDNNLQDVKNLYIFY